MTKTEAKPTPIQTALALIYKKFPSLPDGIYIGLDANRYHADTALGSSNIRDLLKGANLFWHKSFLNPKKKPEKLTPSKIVGNATHKLLLEGKKAYDEIYIRGPYNDGDDYTSAEKTALTKKAKEKLLEGQELLAADDWDFVMGCKEVLDTDPELKGCLDNALTEVSVFWTRADGVRCKVRLDALKLRGIGDIKTIANERERDMEVACKLDIHTYRYDIPSEHYTEGRYQMKALFDAGKVFIGDELEPIPFGPKLAEPHKKLIDFLRQCVSAKEFGFQLVFIPKKGAPDAWSCTLTRGNPIMTGARQDIETAISYFRMALDKYGLEQRWIPNREITELDIETMPAGFGRIGARR
jgi:PDDEXK-like domain of unknown function (DUF3799)